MGKTYTLRSESLSVSVAWATSALQAAINALDRIAACMAF
jgi:hypothetical protein